MKLPAIARLTTACLALSWMGGLLAQDAFLVPAAAAPGLAPMLAGMPEHGLPGTTPGTERWIAHFRERSFDLVGLREAILSKRSAGEVAAITADLERRMQLDQAAFVAAAQALGAKVTHQWWLVNAAAFEIAPARLAELRQLPMVAFVQPEVRHDAEIRTATNASNHNAAALHSQGHRGAGVAVGIMDTGQDENMNGTGRPHRTYFLGGDPNNTTGGGIGGSRLVINRQIGALFADDQQGHGTGVASVSAGANWGTSAAGDGHAPMAAIAGYAIANQVSGGASSNTTMASAWQAMVADRAQFNIVAANLSYGGSPNPLDVAQQALDAAALNADIMCCVAAGNSGPNPGTTTGSQGAANGLAVAAVANNTHTVASFSSRGPLAGDTARFYPDIAACGVSTVMARRDSETTNYTGSGTSMASPQVAGAATQLRARFPLLTALQTKAILLAATQDISAANSGLDRNAYGVGFLKNDRAHSLTQAGNFGTANVTTTANEHWFSLPVTAGQSYAVAIAWHRQVLSSASWSNLDLEVYSPTGGLMVASNTPRNLYEMVRVFAPTTGNLAVRVVARSFSGTTDQQFAFAWTVTGGFVYAGEAIAAGAGCLGTGSSPPLCAGVNTNGGALAVNTRTNEYGYDLNAPSAMQVLGFELFSRSNTGGTVLVGANLYGNAGGVPSTLPLASTTIAIGPTDGFHAATFAQPVTLPQGPFWIGIDHRAQTTLLSQLDAGDAGGAYFRATFGSGVWQRSALITRPSLRVDCSTAIAVPLLQLSGSPRLGQTPSFALSRGVGNSFGFLALGWSNTTSSAGPLPFSLAPLGAPNCFVHNSTDAVQFALLSGQGGASLPFAIPNLPTLVYARVHGQYLVADPAANTLGIAVSNGLTMAIGN